MAATIKAGSDTAAHIIEAEHIIADGMNWPYGYATRHESARAALAAVAYNIAHDLAAGEQVTEGQLTRFRYLDGVIAVEESK